MALPLEDQKFLQKWCQVFKSKGEDGRWMLRSTLKKNVIMGKADGWWVVQIDVETGDKSLVCPYCATGVEHRGAIH